MAWGTITSAEKVPSVHSRVNRPFAKKGPTAAEWFIFPFEWSNRLKKAPAFCYNRFAAVAQEVEHRRGKEEVASSNLASSLI